MSVKGKLIQGNLLSILSMLLLGGEMNMRVPVEVIFLEQFPEYKEHHGLSKEN